MAKYQIRAYGNQSIGVYCLEDVCKRLNGEVPVNGEYGIHDVIVTPGEAYTPDRNPTFPLRLAISYELKMVFIDGYDDEHPGGLCRDLPTEFTPKYLRRLFEDTWDSLANDPWAR